MSKRNNSITQTSISSKLRVHRCTVPARLSAVSTIVDSAEAGTGDDVRMAEIPPDRCPNGHRFGPRLMLVGWDNTHDPPCRVYICRRCDARVWVERIMWRNL